MNDLERLLTDDVERLIERVATSLPQDTVGAVRTSMPRLWTRLEEADERLAETRSVLIEEYARWRQELDDIENLWALAAWKTGALDQPVSDARPTAA